MAEQALFGDAVLDQAKLKEAEAHPKAMEIVEALVNEYALLVFRISYSILRNHHDAEDAAQECFLRVLKAQKRLALVRNPKTWLARIAWTTALDRRHGRATQHLGEEALVHIPDSAMAADEQLAGQQQRQLLKKLMAGLPEDLRRPLELSTVQELNSTEIAEIMDIPESSVRTRLHRARKMLKDKLAALEVTNHA